MKNAGKNDISSLQRDPKHIRNICILAHVDHGKTTLADSLVASNGIISQRMAGKLRYLDSRPDEQERGITMKASAIALQHVDKLGQSFLVNLIDSPGHVDFSGEVSTAVRVCDGSIVVVDVVEGCAAQTVQVLRQAWMENIRPILVLNKIDRLILEKKMTVMEAYQRLVQVLEQVNAVMGSLFATDFMSKQDAKREQRTNDAEKILVPKEQHAQGDVVLDDWDAGLEEADDSSLYFQPELQNVVFASAVDGWGFTVERFVDLYHEKLGISRKVLNQTLWGDFWLNAKEKKIMRGAQQRGKKPLFVQFILENLWQVYDAVCVKKNKDQVDKIVNALGLKIPPRDAKQADPKGHLFAICSQWLPLGKTILNVICDKLPSPADLSSDRVESLISSHRQFSSLRKETQALKPAFLSCASDPPAPAIAFVCKMVSVDSSNLSSSSTTRTGRSQALTAQEIAAKREAVRKAVAAKHENGSVDDGVSTAEPDAREERKEGQVFLAIARIFSGTLRAGDELYALGPKYNPEHVVNLSGEAQDQLPAHVKKVVVKDVYAMVGRDMERLEEGCAGNVVAVSGLENVLVRTGTLSSTLACPAFTDLMFMAAPIVRVAVEPKRITDLPQLAAGLKLLYQADPCVEVFVQETGEHVLVTAGEVHLQRCLRDLTETFAKIEIVASPPIVAYRETVVIPPKVDRMNEAIAGQKVETSSSESKATLEAVEMWTPNKQCRLRVKAYPLPLATSQLMDQNIELIQTLHRSRVRRPVNEEKTTEAISKETDSDADEEAELEEHLNVQWKTKLDEFRKNFEESLFAGEEFDSLKDSIPDFVQRICCFGPRNCGPNFLVNCSSLQFPLVWHDDTATEASARDCTAPLMTGFQLATLSGPLCEEPLMGVCYVIEDVEIAERNEENASGQTGYAALSGQLISTMKEACRRAFQTQPQRIMLAMYSCIIQATGDVLGKVYAVINRRRGRILSEEMQEGSDVFNIHTMMPVCESFGFAEEIRKRTSGVAQPQLVFSHWEVLEMDPFWTPSSGTEEEYAHYGEKADAENIALKYVNQVRKRKGLHVEEKLVAHAEKQRTIKRNK